MKKKKPAPATGCHPAAWRVLHGNARAADPCQRYAHAELVRLLARAGIRVEPGRPTGSGCTLALAKPGAAVPKPDLRGLRHDGYRIRVFQDGVLLCAREAKGLLNAVYDLAERIGFLFLLPGEAWEWPPEKLRTLPIRDERINPRFPHRGVFWQPLENCRDFGMDDWLRFYAKLRFNALAVDGNPDPERIRELGLRLERGGHGLSDLLPRGLFEKRPELFRMFQPEDFKGKRVADSNFCPTHPDARRLVKESFTRRLAEIGPVHALHAWADDLPGGGWCLCPSCRSLSPADQAQLAMRTLCEAVREAGSKVRIPVIAYHDTMFPGATIRPPKESFYLFAPRERCYGHALDDDACPLNRNYLKALRQWSALYAGRGDAHTFEYYFDQILFRGLYPFLPEVMLRDLATYERHGIECCLSLQVAGPELVPEQNLLLFSRAHWDRTLTASRFRREWAERLRGVGSVWAAFLEARGRCFQEALRMCGHPYGIYLDYRWLPENDSVFGREQVSRYARAATALARAARGLRVPAGTPEPVKDWLARERARAAFEAAELRAMAAQQAGLNALGRWYNSGRVTDLARGLAALREAVRRLATARAAAKRFGLSPDSWYFQNINAWIRRELLAKIAKFAPELRRAARTRKG